MGKTILAAKNFGFNSLYLETMPELSNAIKLYEKLGFKTIDKQLGDKTELKGLAAIANAVMAYEVFLEFEKSSRWQKLLNHGGNLQRPLWASTGVKNPAYSDTQYVIELIAPDTVNTMPQSTLDALIDHGDVRGNTISGKYPEAVEVLKGLSVLGISLDQITTDLEVDGVKKFAQAWDELLENVKAAQQS